jgi:hypothetical protein
MGVSKIKDEAKMWCLAGAEALSNVMARVQTCLFMCYPYLPRFGLQDLSKTNCSLNNKMD